MILFTLKRSQILDIIYNLKRMDILYLHVWLTVWQTKMDTKITKITIFSKSLCLLRYSEHITTLGMCKGNYLR